MSVLISSVITDIHNKLEAFLEEGAALITVEAEQADSTRFRMPHTHIIHGSEVVQIDGSTKVLTTDYTIDHESGWVTFVVAPGENAVVTVDYRYRLFSEDELLQAINEAILYVGPTLPTRAIDTSLHSDSSTYEQALPADVAHIERVEIYDDSTSTYKRQYDWTTYESSNTTTGALTRYLRFLAMPNPMYDGQDIRLFYVRALGEADSTLTKELQKDIHIQDKARRPLVLYACWSLLYHQIAVRQRENAFLNQDAPNVQKVYEALRFADSLRVMCDSLLDRARSTPRLRRL